VRIPVPRRPSFFFSNAYAESLIKNSPTTQLISPTNPEPQEYMSLTREVTWWFQQKPLTKVIVDENIEKPPIPKK
jgi:hypothetical protein